jgi:hypothetical protein
MSSSKKQVTNRNATNTVRAPKLDKTPNTAAHRHATAPTAFYFAKFSLAGFTPYGAPGTNEILKNVSRILWAADIS